MRLRSLQIGAALTMVLVSCGPRMVPYAEPPVHAPHAMVKVRLVHHATPGPMYTGSIQLNQNSVDLQLDPTAPATRALRLRPEGANWRFQSEFYHLVSRTETYTTSESYVCGQTTTSYGSTPQYCTRQVQRTRTVTDHVTDAACAAVLSHAPAANTIYLVQFDFTATGNCSAACFEQKQKDDGTMSQEPCIGSRAMMAQ